MEGLQKKFPDPLGIIQQLIQPVSVIDQTLAPHLSYKHMFGGRLVRATLKFQWPVQFKVIGQRDSVEKATHNAYLNACAMLTVRACFIDGLKTYKC